MVGQYFPYRDARLVLTAENPECRHKNRLRGQPAWLLGQNAGGNVSCSDKIAEMKEEYMQAPRPSNTQFGWVWRTRGQRA